MFSVKKPLPFHDASALFLIWLTALMSFIAVLILTASLGMTNVIGHWNRSVSGSLTIQVPTYDLKGQDRTEMADNDVNAIQMYLLAQPAVQSVRILSEGEMADLLEPWLGNVGNTKALPLPHLMDIQLSEPDQFSFTEFQTELSKIAPFAKADSHRIWLSKWVDLLHGLQKIIFFILALLGFTTSVTVIYTTKSSLKIQSGTLSLLKMMGARCCSIAFGYSFRHFVKAFLGAFLGLVFAFPILWILRTFLKPLEESFFETAELSGVQWIIILIIPIVAGLLAWGTTFITVWRNLREKA